MKKNNLNKHTHTRFAHVWDYVLVVGNNVTSNFATSNVVSTLVVALLTGTNTVLAIVLQ